MKKIVAVLIALTFLVLTACTVNDDVNPDDHSGEKVEISLWTYPIGGWGKLDTVNAQIASFTRDHPNISIVPKVVDYVTGDDEINDAIESGNAPDIVFEGPERLVANWGARGLMVDISDMLGSKVASSIDPNVRAACHNSAGNYYIYPLCMTTHCMAINKDMFVEAGAWQYVDEETHTWSTEDFFNAVKALKAHGIDEVAAIYCGGQGGDQGTRALVTNLYSGTFTNAEHTRYTVNSAQNIKALTELKKTEGIVFKPNYVGSNEIESFCKGELAMAFCWNVSNEIQQTVSQNVEFDIFPMTFPTDDGIFDMQGGIWGFGIFDNKDKARIDAAKEFIKYIAENDSRYSSAVITSTYWPVRDIPDPYLNNKIMNEYSVFKQYLGDYYQITPGWANARTEWWKMLQKIGAGADIETSLVEFSNAVNKTEE